MLGIVFNMDDKSEGLGASAVRIRSPAKLTRWRKNGRFAAALDLRIDRRTVHGDADPCWIVQSFLRSTSPFPRTP